MQKKFKMSTVNSCYHKHLFLFIILSAFAVAQVKLPQFFGDNMVLQRGSEINIWGWSEPDTKVTVVLDDTSMDVRSNARGEWQVALPKRETGGPYKMTIVGPDTVKLINILIGDVWICSGQSNMGMKVGGSSRINNYKEEVSLANYPQIRIMTVDRGMAAVPLKDLETDGWSPVTPETVEEFSATAYFFGRELQKGLEGEIPIGLIHTSWGGTKVEAWTRGGALKEQGLFIDALEKVSMSTAETDQEIIRHHKAVMKAWEAQVDSLAGDLYDGQSAEYLESHPEWPTMAIPNYWENLEELKQYDGVMWFQKEITFPQTWAGQPLFLSLGLVDDYDWTYMNTNKIGHTHSRSRPVEYTISADQFINGSNTLSVRVKDVNRRGGIWGQPQDMFITPLGGGDTLWLAGEWRYHPVLEWATHDVFPPSRPYLHNRPSVLYNAMIAPLIPMSIKGAIWYQGEANASKAQLYRTTFPLMITDWRKQWDQGDFPFLYVQLPNFGPRSLRPAENAWAELRDAQLQTLKLPNTSMAVTIDIGNERNIHPKNKQDVGLRLALLALRDVYDNPILAEGPRYKAYKKRWNKIIVEFENIGEGLTSTDGLPLEGFSIAGKNGVFYWADARIRGQSIIVRSKQVKRPVAVRYAWGGNPRCNLTNSSGIPASPFKTDDWPDSTGAP